MDNYLHVSSAGTIPGSPSTAYLADEVASICPLITPSPPTNDLINPPSEPSETNFTIGEELANKLHHVQGGSNIEADSSSSSSLALGEPACTLLNHRNNYHHIIKDEETAAQETNGKTQALQLTFRNPPDNYFFMSWNWPLIRKISYWAYLSILAAMVALVIAMISSLPTKCNPQVEWYQGSVFYEIFPASFSDTNNDMTGDFRGISQNADYIMSLEVRAVRLNSIFNSPHYPEDYKNPTSLIDIAKPLGSLEDFQKMVKHLKSRNISLLLDLPIWPYVKQLRPSRITPTQRNETSGEPTLEFLRSNLDPIEEALVYWSVRGVDGFYLKGLEHLVKDVHFASSLQRWKRLIGFDKIFIVSEDAFNNVPKDYENVILENVALVDMQLKIELGVNEVSKQIENVQNSSLFHKPGMPWVHWSIGDETTKRLANRLPIYGNGTLGAQLLQLMLPGTPSIFYGDEIGIQQIHDPQNERQDIEHLHNLTPMQWPNQNKKSLSWIHGESTNIVFDQVDSISKLVALRSESPSIYMNMVHKQGIIRNNAQVKYSREDLLVIQRWYPRRKNYVVVSNLGKKQVTADLSNLLYAGEVIVGPKTDSRSGSVSFKDISLWPAESVVIVLD